MSAVLRQRFVVGNGQNFGRNDYGVVGLNAEKAAVVSPVMLAAQRETVSHIIRAVKPLGNDMRGFGLVNPVRIRQGIRAQAALMMIRA